MTDTKRPRAPSPLTLKIRAMAKAMRDEETAEKRVAAIAARLAFLEGVETKRRDAAIRRIGEMRDKLKDASATLDAATTTRKALSPTEPDGPDA